MDLELLADPATFLAAAGDHLAAHPVLATVVATVASRAVAEIADGVPQVWEHTRLHELGELVARPRCRAPGRAPIETFGDDDPLPYRHRADLALAGRG